MRLTPSCNSRIEIRAVGRRSSPLFRNRALADAHASDPDADRMSALRTRGACGAPRKLTTCATGYGTIFGGWNRSSRLNRLGRPREVESNMRGRYFPPYFLSNFFIVSTSDKNSCISCGRPSLSLSSSTNGRSSSPYLLTTAPNTSHM